MMTSSWVDAVIPTPAYFSDSDWFLDEKKTGNWTEQENKLFENALAHYDRDSPDRWAKVAGMIPGKTVDDIRAHYRDLEEDVSCIEAGLIPLPGYSSSSFTLDWASEHGFDLEKQAYCIAGKRSGSRLDHERKKGVPWTEEEHRRFLLGLKKYGKGDWRNISRNFVISRTPTQVASHAQKYFIRLNSGSKDKRRASIHDITTINMEDSRSPSPSQRSVGSMQSCSATIPSISEQISMVDAKKPNELPSGFGTLADRNQFIHSPYGIQTYGIKDQKFHVGNLNNSIDGYHGVLF